VPKNWSQSGGAEEAYDQGKSPQFPVREMLDDFGKSNIIVFTVATVFIQTCNGTNFLFLFEESRQLREIDNEKPTKHCHSTRDRAFNDEDKPPASILTSVNSRQAVGDDPLTSERAEIDDTENPEAKILDI